MEKQAAWCELQVQNENDKRQQRSNRGQTLDMLQEITTVPDTDLPSYLHAFVLLCETDSKEQFDRRFEDLEGQFGRQWSELSVLPIIRIAF